MQISKALRFFTRPMCGVRSFSSKQVSIVNASRVDWQENLDYSRMEAILPVNLHFDGPGVDPTDSQFIERV
jgi:hypothetical protein